jgi:hypothetical protein
MASESIYLILDDVLDNIVYDSEAESDLAIWVLKVVDELNVGCVVCGYQKSQGSKI